MLISHAGLVLLVPLQLLHHRLHLLEQRDEDNEGGGGEGPSSADHGPGVELSEVEDVDGEHGARPDNNEEDGEADSGNVGGDLGGSELADDDV